MQTAHPTQSVRPTLNPRGSVLVFAIVLLAILSMLGTAFLLTVRQSGMASTSAMTGSEADFAARSAFANALGPARTAVLRYMICTPEGVYEPSSPGFYYSPQNDGTLTPPAMNAYVTTNTSPYVSPLIQFRGFDASQPRANLTLDTSGVSQTAFTSEALGAAHFPTSATLVGGAAGTGAIETVQVSSLFNIYIGTELSVDTGGNFETVLVQNYNQAAGTFDAAFIKPHAANALISIPEYARRNTVTGASVNEIYQTTATPNVKELGKLAANADRGEYYNWIADLDARLYAAPKDWGLDNTNTGYTPPINPAKGILEFLGFNDPDIDDLIAAAPAFTGDSRFPAYRSNNEVLLTITSTAKGPTGDPQYSATRAMVDQYLSCYKDTADFKLPLNLKFCKDWSSAININTAPLEVIAAALSQIPSDINHVGVTGAGSPLGQVICTDNVSLAVHLAKRIVAKRPFVCRMDFEDFLAANIMGSVGDEASGSDSTSGWNPTDDVGGGQVIPPDTDPMWSTNDYWDDPVSSSYFPSTPSAYGFNAPVTYFLYFAIGRRWGPGNTLVNPGAADPTYPLWLQVQNPEMSLSQWLEIPGVPDNHPRFQVNVGGTYYPMNTPIAQKARFRFFVGSAAERLTVCDTEGSLITTKEFNNIVNSVTAIYVNSDVQTLFPGEVHGSAAICVTPGAGGINTTPQGDDQYVFDAGGNITGINCGANGVSETWISLNRPSYYSYFNDAAMCDEISTTIEKAMADYATANPNGPPEFYNPPSKSLLEPKIAAVPVVDAASPYVGKTIGQIVGDPVAHTGMQFQTKFFYLPKVIPGVPAPPPPALPPLLDVLEMTDMIFWRCRPYNSAKTDGRAGFYQVSFDDWSSVSSSNNYGYSLGVMQVTGDPDAVGLYSTAKAPSQGLTDGSGASGNGDCNWSPQFAYRSRFYGIYSLGHGLLQGASGSRTVGERRIEGVYDALEDQVLWQRSPASDKRALGD